MKINTVCVIGLGYVGLTLATILAKSGFEVFGIEKDKKKLSLLKKRKPHFHEKGLAELLKKTEGKQLHLLQNIPSNKRIDCFIIAVSTPVDEITKEPKIDSIIAATEEIAPYVTSGQLVVLRSTIPVGATRKIVLPILKKRSEHFLLSFCPERTAEGKALEELKTLPQVVGGLDQASTDASVELFSKISPLIVGVSSLEAAEIVKLVNNSYRDLVFAYANQVAFICKSLGLNAKEVIDAANLGYPRSDVKSPGVVGGFCLEKDPHILMKSAKYDVSLIKAAKELNESVVGHILHAVQRHLKARGKDSTTARVFICGFAFKGEPETDDLRSSQAIKLLKLLKDKGFSNIYGHDPLVTKKLLRGLGIRPVSIGAGFKDADVAIFMNNHKSYSGLKIEPLSKKMRKGGLIFDGWHMFYDQLWDSNYVKYESLGFSSKKR